MSALSAPPRPLVVYWFRNDLRLHDHPCLTAAIAAAAKASATFLPVYCLDDRFLTAPGPSWQCSRSPHGAPGAPFVLRKAGPIRARFLLASLSSLRSSLEARGSGLHVLRGAPEERIPALVAELKPSSVSLFGSLETASEEAGVAARLRRRLPAGAAFSLSPGAASLYAASELPFPRDASGAALIPDVCTPFRTRVERELAVPSPLPPPSGGALRDLPFPALPATPVPSLAELGYSAAEAAAGPDPRSAFRLPAGEKAALRRVEDYFFKEDRLKT
ncbi:hypothetical protein TeGR_g8094 [Tetraparma gracilis]|uniref:Photolyase/cryptochrome alpha/beta domain-containing protein n=1 Tax=Tetraparma gracilis TaxID=2962635 RepID=A0ABQ6MTM9_9STRA|nr:hypothetical protein TeGR_g8094 [Tetraparma gracilis]